MRSADESSSFRNESSPTSTLTEKQSYASNITWVVDNHQGERPKRNREGVFRKRHSQDSLARLPQQCAGSVSTGISMTAAEARGRKDDDVKTAIIVWYGSGPVGWIADRLRARGGRGRRRQGIAAVISPVARRERG